MLKKIATQFMLALVLISTFLAPLHLQFSGSITLNTNTASAQQDPAEEALQNTYALPVCFNLSEGFSVTGCTGQLLYWLFWWPTQWLAARAGGFLDYFIFFSIDGNTYRGVPIELEDGSSSSFILEGWKIVRDISNILFIFGLIYIAFAFVLRVNIGNANPKKLLVYLIVMALLINFSLFFARVIVDAGNILARTLYNQINLVTRNAANQDLTGPDGVKSIGLMFISLSNPQALMSSDQSNVTSFNNTDTETNLFIMMTLGAIIFNIFLIYIFISVSVYFIARIIGLYYSMIFAPFAFASMAIPKGSSIQYIGFNSWFSNLVSYSFLAPLFIFFLYLTIKFLSLGIPINPNVAGSTPLAQTFMSILIPFALAIGFLILGKQQAKKMSGKIGEVTSKVVTSAVAGAAGVAVGAAAFGATQTVGRVGRAIGNSERMKQLNETGRLKIGNKEFKLGKTGQALGKATVLGGNRLSRQTFDIRQGKASAAASRLISGVASASGGSAPNINTGIRTQPGGFSARQDKRQEEQRKKLERREKELQLSGTSASQHDKEAKEWNKGLDADKAQKYEQAKAAAEASFRKTDSYTNASDIQKERLLKAMQQEFDEKYKNGEVIETYKADGTYEKPRNELQDRTNQAQADEALKKERLDRLKSKLTESDAWKKADSAQKKVLEDSITQAFDRNYAKGQVVTDVTSQGTATNRVVSVSGRDDVGVGWDARWKGKIAEEYQNEKKYKRMKTSTEINNDRSRLYGLQQRDSGLLSRSRDEATRQFGYDTVNRVNKDSVSAQHITKLTNNLNNLNDTLGSLLHLEQQGGFDNLNAKELLDRSAAVQSTEIEAALKRAGNMDPREVAKILESMSAKLAAEIAVLDAQIKSAPASNTKLISDLARQKQLLENKRKRIQGGFEEQSRLTTQINNARNN